MSSQKKSTNDILFERVNFNGILQTKVVITKEKKPLLKNSVSVPKWKLFIYGLVITLLTGILISTVLIISMAPRPGLYLENCKSRSCESKLNMKCINGTCLCTSDQYYLKGCKQKKDFKESCIHKDGCKSNLNCLYGKCSCKSGFYWSGISCVDQKNYGDYCTDSSECLTSLYLYCYNGLCTCNSTRFWTGYVCWRKNSFGEPCRFSSLECLNSDYISCINNTCFCNDTFYYYNTTSLMCQLRKNETDSCVTNYQCLGDMLCLGTSSNKKCECAPTYYFNYAQLKCEPKTGLNTNCQSTNRTCRDDLGLSCQSNICQCNNNLQFWYNSSIGCVNYFTYSEATCFSDSNCLPGSSLFCNLNTTANQCNCPTTSVIGMCDCIRVTKNESYWDSNSLTCKPAMNEWSTCNHTYQCMSDMYCNSTSKQCECEFTKYFDYSAYVCVPKTLNSTSCLSTNTCRSDLGLSCQSGFCLCNESIQFWFNSTIGCINHFSYSQSICFSDANCLPGSSLFCNTNPVAYQCDCPATSTNGMCDCYRVSGNESYWDPSSLSCKPAINEWQSCNSTYQCLTPMYCNSTSKLCQCLENYYYNETADDCLAKTLESTYCSNDTTCRADLGLSCQLNTCKCNETIKFWYNSSIGCVNYFTYNEATCFSDSNCLPGSSLFCNLNTTANQCNCPTTSVIGMCDCIRVTRNESYWDSNSLTCKPAMNEWSTCNHTYQCMSDIYCNSTSKQCECEFTKYFDYSAYVCVPKTLNSTSCLSTNTCRSDLGLSCQSGFCLCNESIQFWSNSSNGCMNYFKYGEQGCSSDSQCLSGKSLFCNLNAVANPCNCNVTSVNGMCDCVRVNGNESYWDYSSDSCVAAKTYNSVCISSHECRTITEKTSCSSGRCICVNGTNIGFLKSNGVCGYCLPGWKYISSSVKCLNYSSIGAGGTCPQQSFLACVSLKCNSTFSGSSPAILSTSIIFNETISKFIGIMPFTIGTFIGGYYDASSTWRWADGSAMSTTVIAGQWKPGSSLSPTPNPVCLTIELSITPMYFTNAECNSNYNILCQMDP